MKSLALVIFALSVGCGGGSSSSTDGGSDAAVVVNGCTNFSDLTAGGDSPNPIQATSSGMSKSFTFDSPGTFGFGCGIHASMFGAVLVEP